MVEPVGEVTTFTLPDGPEESDIFVQPVANISDDFIRGMDASAVLSVENSGAVYYLSLIHISNKGIYGNLSL